MKKAFLLFFIFCVCLLAQAQRVYFIYLQSESGIPFFVKMGDKVFSSTASGYVILSKLVDSTYTFTIGTPDNQNIETVFSVALNKNDKGFLLKGAGADFSLYDLQHSQVIKPVSNNIQAQSSAVKSDNFTKLLSQAADDPTLLIAPVVHKQEVATVAEKKEPVKPVIELKSEKKDTAIALKTVITEVSSQEKNTIAVKKETQPPVIKDTIAMVSKTVENPNPAPPISYKRSIVAKRSESSTTEGFGLVFLDKRADAIDTIRLLIPNQKLMLQPGALSVNDTTLLSQKKESQAMQTATSVKPITKAASICTDIATESDFMKLRKSMAAKENDDAMVDEAKKFFRKKCFTVDQVKYLSALFLTPAGKYQFFDAAYSHVTDPATFKTLQTEIKDDYYITRFKALTSNQ